MALPRRHARDNECLTAHARMAFPDRGAVAKPALQPMVVHTCMHGDTSSSNFIEDSGCLVDLSERKRQNLRRLQLSSSKDGVLSA